MITRRQFAIGAVMVAGDGLRRPLNAPTPGTLGYGVQPGTSNGVIQARRVIVYGPNDGVFVYAGAPGPNTLLLTENGSLPTTDPYNNYVPAGLTIYGEASPPGPGVGTAWSIGFNGINSYLTNSSGANSQQGIWSQVSTTALTAGDFISSVPVVAELPGGTPTSPEVWHLMGFLNGWAQQAGNVACQYRLTPTNEVRVVGIMSGNAATARTFAQLPAGYRPVSQQPFFLQVNAAAGGDVWGQCDTSGNLTVQGAAVAAGTYVFSGMISLDA